MIANKLELFFISIICAKKQPSIFSILLLSSNFKAIDEILNFPKTSFTAPKLGSRDVLPILYIIGVLLILYAMLGTTI